MRQLMACLNGDPPGDCRWEEVLALANQSLITPQLAAAVDHRRSVIPPQVAGFLDDVRARNIERNRRLWRELDDAVKALAEAGIVPTLLKGAARWAAWPGDKPFDRMLSDIDLLIAPSEVEAGVAALSRAGFGIAARYPGPSVHVVAELGRPQDPGYIDLHQRPPGPPGLSDTPALILRRRPMTLSGRTVMVPDAASQLFYLLLHDQFHDGGFWRGGFDLRHLIDVAALAHEMTAADRQWLHEACGTSLVRTALDAILFAAVRLVAASHPGDAGGGAGAWTYRRWLLQYSWPALRLPLAGFAALLNLPKLRAYRSADIKGRRRVLGDGAQDETSIIERLGRARRILSVAPGKI